MLIGSILQVRNVLGSIRDITELSRGKFRDKEFGESFCRFIAKEIEIGDLLLTSLLHYIKTGTPIEKTNTVHTLIGQALSKYRAQLEEKNIKTTETFEENLPETVVPDEQLKYILNSVLLYAVASTPPSGRIEFLTRSLSLQRDAGGGQAFFVKAGRYIEIRLVVSSVAKPTGWSGRATEGITSLEKDVGFDLLLRLAKEVVLRNQGVMKFETDEEKAKMIISLGFPVERRKVFSYKPISISRPTNPSMGAIPNIPFL
ncbi:MAG TPA: hypothetical protein VK568_11680 [Thermodesulfobacteriota bacterium]|nr:hypothetical protein [Thermodesulfobacteriota bacterium]